MLSTVKAWNIAKEEFTNQVKYFVQNKHIPLDERWEVFVEAKVGSTDRWAERFESLEELFGENFSWYDDLYIDRHTTVNTIDLEDRLYEGENDTTNFKEEVMQKFILSFVYDW